MIGLHNSIGGDSSPILYWFWDDITDTIGDITDTVEEVFDNMGHYCVEWANGALEAYQNLTSSATEILQTDIDSGIFSDFWTVINKVSSVFCIIASSLIVLFFLISLCSEAWETRHELDIWSLIKDLVKLIVSVVVVNNALWFVKTIFIVGARLAMLVTFTNTDISENLGLSGTNATYLANGISGIRGLFIFIVFLLAALVVVICGVIVTMEVYQRVFKIYILIPFASLSFSTFVIGSHQHGSEVFHGYIKSIIQTALEGIVIMIILFFSYSLINNGKVMKTLFPTYNEFDVVSLTAENEDDLQAIQMYLSVYCKYESIYNEKSFSEYLKEHCDNYLKNPVAINPWDDVSYENVSKSVIDALDKVGTEINAVEGNYNNTNRFRFSSTVVYQIGKRIEEANIKNPEVGIIMYPKCSTIDSLMILLQFVFPICLCAGAVKAAGTYSAMVLGR